MQRMPNLLLLFAVIAVLAASCRKDIDNNPVGGGNNTPTVTTTIIGVVSDESGTGMSGVVVSAHGKTATTNENGLFIIKDARVPEDRCFVIASNGGYFNNSRAEKPKAGGITHMRLSMMRNATNYTVNASAGGTVDISEGGSIQLPADGYVGSGGEPYAGTVKVAARWLNPVEPNFYSFFPGDFAATRTDGSQTELYSYGVLNVELMSQTGEKLQLGSGKKAILKYPIPSSMLATAPAEIPLWYFDETIGMWKEEGTATKVGSFYIGEVSHFTPWNVDVPVDPCTIRGRVLCNGGPVSDIIVRIGQGEAITDENGYYEYTAPAGMVIAISVEAAKNLGMHTEAPITVGPLSPGTSVTVDIPVGPCPSYITGTLVDCDGKPTDGVVQVKGSTGYGYVAVKNGRFSIRVEAGVEMKLDAIGYNTGVSDLKNIQAVAECNTREAGNIGLCPQKNISFTDIATGLNVSRVMALSSDGSRIAISSEYSVRVYDTQDGALVYTMNAERPGSRQMSFSSDGSMLLVAFGSSAAIQEGNVHIVNTKTWSTIRTFSGTSTGVFTPDAKSVLVAEYPSRNIVRYNIATGAETGRFDILGPPTMHGPLLLGTRSNGRQFICQTYNYETFASHIVIWDMVDNISVNEFAMELRNYPGLTCFSADGLRMLEETSGGVVNLYNTITGQIFNSVVAKTGNTNSPASALSPDGTRFVVQVYDKGTPMLPGVFNAADGAPLYMLPSPGEYHFSAYAYNDNGSILVGLYNIDNSSNVRIWRLP